MPGARVYLAAAGVHFRTRKLQQLAHPLRLRTDHPCRQSAKGVDPIRGQAASSLVDGGDPWWTFISQRMFQSPVNQAFPRHQSHSL